MRYFAVADNADTLTGLRLAGIEGVRANNKAEVQYAVSEAMLDPTIGIILITEKLAEKCPDVVYDMKLKNTNTLVVEIPDRHGTGRSPDSITRFIREAIGVKI